LTSVALGDHPAQVRVLFYYRGIENLGIGYLMSMLKAHGHEIDLIFDPGLDDNLFLKAPHLAWLNRHQALLERAVAFGPDLIAIGSPTNIWPFASKMAEKLKQKIGVPILVGGHHAQALPDYVLANPNVDMVCIERRESRSSSPLLGRGLHDHPDAVVQEERPDHPQRDGGARERPRQVPLPGEAALVGVRLLQGQPRGLHGARLPLQVHLLQHPLPARDIQREGRLSPQALDPERHGGVQAEPGPLRRQVRLRPRRQLHHQPALGGGVLRGVPEGGESPLVLLRLSDHAQAPPAEGDEGRQLRHHLHGRRLGRPGHPSHYMERPMSDEPIYARRSSSKTPASASDLVHLRNPARLPSRCSRRSR
jgi:hypothetical protein